MNVKRFRRRRRSYEREMRRRPINVLASAMTTLNLYMGMLSIFASIGNEYDRAAYLIFGAIIFDMLDGTVARLTKTSSEFGKQLDSLCDVVSFGVAPGVLVFSIYLQFSPETWSFIGKTGSFTAIVFAICAALRLARFNIYQADRHDSFTGLPSPAAGGTLAAFVLFLRYFESPLQYYVLAVVTVSLAWLMVSTVRYPKERLKKFVIAPRSAFRSLAYLAFVIAVIHYAVTISPTIVLFPLAALYVCFGLADTAYSRFMRRQDVPPISVSVLDQMPEASPSESPEKTEESL